jgi:anti-sigma-K factor RskA
MSDHDVLRSLAAPYALGIADAAETAEFEAHLATCAECRAELADLRRVNEGLGLSSTPATPPPQLRRRIIEAAGGKTPARPLPWWLAAAASLVAILATAQWLNTENQLRELRAQLADARQQLATAEGLRASAERASADAASRLAIIAAADSIAIPLAGQPSSPNAIGRVVFSPSRGVVFTANNLPSLPQGRVYQLWAVASPAPVGLALVTPAPGGQADAVAAVPAGVTPTAFALTIEPEGGSPGPTGAMYLVGSR